MASTPHVWLITGCSAGFGISIARAVLAHGHLVVATSRNPTKTPDLVEEITQKGGHWLTLDVTSPEEDIKKVVEKARDLYGHIDVVVNNAGFAVVSALEDVDESAIRAQFETNVYGLIKVTKSVLPIMRNSRSGTIVNMSSVGGLRALPAVSLYSASKHAVEAISEALALELSPFGIRVLLVEPGAFRTNFLGQNAVSYQPPSDPYLGTAVEKTQQYLHSENGKQPGDPEKAAERIYEVVMGEGMAKDKKQYLRLVLGNKAYENARLKVADLSENFLALEDISRSTDY
ncbi:putative short chain oxidoreductase/dehydrogenase [Aspergillus aculeatinus CBS 121060]|uniref:Short chain oxidoreductase/dehydrogenase n=1 Tax=Aspergillus aculeatinus CBS 121060 TaxID=1448322 RepID=A0ACD1HEI2_9EURO|nr:putative short chain oxidoreductase/dehydrogenase [Aspergillus aculeatinus CBS 121060]RAH71914.1 putative short chain oxidoreductase/dehydrogenase [Aspergillus aculeatinus CBS 121060]